MSRVPAGLWRNLIAVQVYGANTGVGKTVLSTLLAQHFLRRFDGKTWSLHYIKPVSTGPAEESDDRYVKRFTGLTVRTRWHYRDPVSPHIAARRSNVIPTDDQLAAWVSNELRAVARSYATERDRMGIAVIETAGGVLSPGPSGNPQADLYRSLRLPVVLVGDHRLGGIAATISAAESLLVRGYDIDALVCFEDGGKYENAEYLKGYFGKMGIEAFKLPWIPDLTGLAAKEERETMGRWYKTEWKSAPVYNLASCILDRHRGRLASLEDLASRTQRTIWHPFTQHKSVEKADDILVFDSAYGDYFQTKHNEKSLDSVEDKAGTSLLYPAFDGSASWWTQGLGHGNPKLSLAAAYAAGRYGHVMFAGATHEPAVTLAERLLGGLENPRLKKCFYTDDGSTAAEVGIKMALRAACRRYDWDSSKEDVGILGLKGSYHGDTIGAMDASEPCVYNKKVDWYRGRGHWLDFPTVKMRKGRWLVEPPPGMEEAFGPTQYFEDLNAVFDFVERGQSPRYEAYIQSILDKLVKEQGKKFGALVMEPVILGAGGMLFVDPLFQRSLVQVVRSYPFASSISPSGPHDPHTWTGLPVLFDEVFTGLYRLGRFSSAAFLQTHSDISIHAKLLTGGLLPLSVTLASESIFRAFWGDEKADALLHGHSYTAHPIGCHVANETMTRMKERVRSHAWRGYRQSWAKDGTVLPSSGESTSPLGQRGADNLKAVWSMWSKDTVMQLSHHPKVDHVFALGSVLVLSLTDSSGSGYTSNAAAGLRDALLYDVDTRRPSVHSRVLGNVIYLMASMTSRPAHLATVEKVLMQKLSGDSGLRGEDGDLDGNGIISK